VEFSGITVSHQLSANPKIERLRISGRRKAAKRNTYFICQAAKHKSFNLNKL